MSNEKFKVKFGLAVGDTVATIDATTGNIVTDGDIQLGGNDIKASDGTTAITVAASTGNVTVAGDLFVRGNDILSNGGFSNINFPASSSNVKIVGDLIVGGNDIQASDGTTALTLSVSTGNVAVAGDLTVNGGGVTLNGTSGGSTFNAPATGSTLSYILPGAAGAANTTLTNDGSGNLSWALPGGGGSTFGNITVGVVNDNTISTTTGNLVIDSATNIITTASQIVSTKANSTTTGGGQIYLNGATGNRIDFNTNGVASPTTTTRSAGTKLVLYPSLSASFVDYAIGADANVLWNSVKSNDAGQSFKWFGGTTAVAELDGTGNLQFDGDLTVSGRNINTGADTSIIIDRTTSTTATAPLSLAIRSTSTGTPAVGFGSTLGFIGQTATSTFKDAGYVSVYSTDIGVGTESFRMDFGLMDNNTAFATKLSLFSNGDLTLADGGRLAIQGATSGYSQFSAPATGSNISYELPGSQGAVNTVLTNNGSGVLSWALPGGGGSTFGNVTVGIDTDQTISTTSGDLILQTAAGVNAGTLTLANGTNGNITLAPNGTGNVVVSTDLVVTGQQISTGFDGAIQIERTQAVTNTGGIPLFLRAISTTTPAVGMGTALGFSAQTAASTYKNAGFITVNSTNITAGSESFNMNFGLMLNNATFATKLTLDSLGNLTPVGNFVKGVIRNATTEANGDMWSFLSGTGTGYRGLSIDNSVLTTKAPATVIRGFTGGASAPGAVTPRVLFERARGTSAAPTALQSGDGIGFITVTGGNGAGTWVGDSVAAAPGSAGFSTSENWSGVTNVGTGFTISLMPNAKTLASVATPTVVYTTTPQATTSRSDSFTWQTGNTTALPGSTTTMTLDNTGQLSAKGNIATTGTLTFNNEVAVNAVTELLDTNNTAGTSVAIQTNYRPSSGSATYSLPQNGWLLGNFRFNSYNTTAGAYALANQVSSQATENWTSTANGSKITFFANKQGSTYLTGQVGVISASPENANIMSDTITLEGSAGTDYAVLDANTAKFNVPVTTEITSATVLEGTTYTPAATVDNNISVQLNVNGGGTTVIDLASLTGNTRGASYNILVYNNTGSGAPIQVKNTRINSNNLMTHTITTGAPRIIINAYVVGDYATATHLVVA